jgi:hypothetical protein
MAWPFSWIIRPLLRTAARWLGMGYSEANIEERLQGHPHYIAAEEAQQATQEARRSIAFREFLESRETARTFGQNWFAAARGVWYAGYGRPPTPEEAQWAYTRPQGMLGLMVRVTGTGAWSGEQQSRSIPVNASWGSTWADVEERVLAAVTSMEITILRGSSEPFLVEGISMEPIGGALLERQSPLLTVE